MGRSGWSPAPGVCTKAPCPSPQLPRPPRSPKGPAGQPVPGRLRPLPIHAPKSPLHFPPWPAAGVCLAGANNMGKKRDIPTYEQTHPPRHHGRLAQRRPQAPARPASRGPLQTRSRNPRRHRGFSLPHAASVGGHGVRVKGTHVRTSPAHQARPGRGPRPRGGLTGCGEHGAVRGGHAGEQLRFWAWTSAPPCTCS